MDTAANAGLIISTILHTGLLFTYSRLFRDGRARTARPLLIATVLLLLHVFVVPLDVLWFTALRRFGLE